MTVDPLWDSIVTSGNLVRKLRGIDETMSILKMNYLVYG